MNSHWTEKSIKDYIFRIAVDFIDQLEKNMGDITKSKLADILGKTKGYVSQVIGIPGNMSLKTIVKFARALGMKVSVVAYEDDDPGNKKGPIDPEIFRICWEKAGKPHDFWAFQETTSSGAETYDFPCPLSWIAGVSFVGW